MTRITLALILFVFAAAPPASANPIENFFNKLNAAADRLDDRLKRGNDDDDDGGRRRGGRDDDDDDDGGDRRGGRDDDDDDDDDDD